MLWSTGQQRGAVQSGALGVRPAAGTAPPRSACGMSWAWRGCAGFLRVIIPLHRTSSPLHPGPQTNKLKKEVAPKPAAVPGAEKLKVKHDLIQAAKAQAKKAKLAAKEKKKAAGPAQQKAAPAAKTHAGKGR